MNEPEITIRLADDRRMYQPGETLAGEIQVSTMSLAAPQAIELSVLWYTEGQGDEDLAVHHFERFDEGGEMGELRRPKPFSTILPNSPLSYDGVLMRVFWCVRVRVFLTRGKEVVVEELFRLGDVPAVTLPAVEEETA